MNTKDELIFLLNLIEQITARYAMLSEELPQLRIVVDNTRDVNIKLKKMPREIFYYSRV